LIPQFRPINPEQDLEFDREPDAPVIQAGTTIACIGAVAQVLDEQKPLFTPDISRRRQGSHREADAGNP
jgi:hypothetical protein